MVGVLPPTLLLVVVMALTACGTGKADRGGIVMTPAMLKVSRSGQTVEQVGQANFRGYYAGVAISADRTGLEVYRRPGSTLDSRIRALIKGVTVIFRDSAHSKAQLDQLTTRVNADIPYWAEHSVTITGDSPASIDGSVVLIEVADPKTAQSPLQNRYGRDWVRIVNTQPPKLEFANY